MSNLHGGDEGQHVLSKDGAHIFWNGNNFVMLKDKKMETIPKNNLGFHAFMKMMIAQGWHGQLPPYGWPGDGWNKE